MKEMRKLKKMTLKNVGILIGVKPNTICQYENNVRKPDYITLQKLAKIFDCKIDDLID